MTPLLEVCASSLASAIAAQRGGASRIELCSSLELGGLTPSLGLIKTVASRVNIPIHVLVRPRSGDFVYSNDDIEIIKNDIKAIGEVEYTNIVGVVIGALNETSDVNVPVMTELVELATGNGLSVTFHRAFDDIQDWQKGLENVIETGCERILSSGGAQNCTEPEALRRLQAMVERAEGRIYIMAGAGVTGDNVLIIVRETGVDEVHASCKMTIPKNERLHSLFAMDRWETDEESVGHLTRTLSKLTESDDPTP